MVLFVSQQLCARFESTQSTRFPRTRLVLFALGRVLLAQSTRTRSTQSCTHSLQLVMRRVHVRLRLRRLRFGFAFGGFGGFGSLEDGVPKFRRRRLGLRLGLGR